MAVILERSLTDWGHRRRGNRCSWVKSDECGHRTVGNCRSAIKVNRNQRHFGCISTWIVIFSQHLRSILPWTRRCHGSCWTRSNVTKLCLISGSLEMNDIFREEQQLLTPELWSALPCTTITVLACRWDDISENKDQERNAVISLCETQVTFGNLTFDSVNNRR